jgi:hypothetical protein
MLFHEKLKKIRSIKLNNIILLTIPMKILISSKYVKSLNV